VFVIRDAVDRKAYWRAFWAEVNVDVDTISREDVYPLFPTGKYVEPGMKLFECGCGMGRVVKHYRARGHVVVGMDYEPECIRRLHRQRPDLTLYVGDVHHLPHSDGAFDAVLAFGTLSNLPDATRPLRELHRVLRPEGIIVASATSDTVLRRFLTFARSLRGDRREFSMMAYTVGEWRQRLEAAGFDVIELDPVVTRLPIYTFFPVLRAWPFGRFRWTTARDGDQGLQLNRLGEALFRAAFRYVPFVVSHAIVAVGRKRPA